MGMRARRIAKDVPMDVAILIRLSCPSLPKCTVQEFACKSVESLKSLGSDGSFYNLDEAKSTNLLDIICDGFLNTDNKKNIGDVSRKRHVFHRLALVDGGGELCHIVSQSDVIKFIYEHLDEFGTIGGCSAEELGFVRGEAYVVKVPPETPAIDAMVLMEERDISAVAVVNSGGEIIGNFSISELRNIMSEHFGSLALPVGEFLALEHGTEYAGYAVTKDKDVSGTSPKPSESGFKFAQDREMRQKSKSAPGHEVGQQLITCEQGTTLRAIMDKIVRHRLHRLYVCTDEMIPVGVITLTDLLRKFANHSCGWGGRSSAPSPSK
jgi:CBS domain-containing protein